MPLGNSSYLQIPLMAESDNQKYLLHNDAIQALDDSLNRLLTLDLSSSDATLTESQLTRYGAFRGTGHAVPRTVTIPTTVGSAPAVTTNRFFIFENRGTDDVTLTHGGAGLTVGVAASSITLVYCDGTDITAVASATGFDMGVRDEGAADFVSNPTFLNFVGGGVAATLNGLGADITVTMPEVEDEGVSVQTDTLKFNFIGAGVTATVNGTGVDVTIPGATSGVDVQEEDVGAVTGATVLNFIGANVTAADVGGEAHVTIQGPAAQDEGVGVQADPTFINFVGAGVTATVNGTGVDVTIPGATSGVDVQEEGVNASTGTTVLNFIGNNVTATDSAGDAQVTIAAPQIQDEGGVAQDDPTFINFIGAGVTAVASGNGINVTIPGASGTAIPVDDDGVNVVPSADTLDFIGAGVSVAANGNTAEVTIPGVATQDDGVGVVTATDTLNFTGSGVTVTNPSGNVTEINITGGGAGSSIGTLPAGSTLLQTLDFGTTPASSFDITDIESYDEILLVGMGNTMVADQQLLMQVSTDNGSTFDTVATNYSTRYENGSGVGFSTTSIGIEVLSDSYTGTRHWQARVMNPGLAVPTTTESRPAGGSGDGYFFYGNYETAAVHNAIRFLTTGGTNINGGTIYVIGIRYAADVYMPWKGARVSLTADEAITATTNTPVPWDQTDRQIGTWWDIGAPTRLTVPAGVTRVRLSGNVVGSSATDKWYAKFQMNGADFAGMAAIDTDTAGTDNLNLHSDIIDVVPGDYFELVVYTNLARNVTAGNASWFAIEAVEGIAYDGNLNTPVAFHARATSDYSAGVVPYDTEDLDEGGDYDNTTGVFTAPRDGLYTFYATGVTYGGGTSDNLYIRVNGLQVARGHMSGSSGTSNDEKNVQYTARLSAGDTVDVESDFTVAAGIWSYFGGYMLNASTGGPLSVIDEIGTTLSSTANHANGYVAANNGAGITYTVEPDSTYNHDVGATITIEQVGAGQVSVSAGAGVTIRCAATQSTRAQYSVIALTKVAANTWNLTGDLTP